ncbi:MAG TPA: glycosyltransferase [Candidatus Saccharimonadales bacterium]|jgi:glycosyltransferase involved in cell wall biosynthesis|nr:glycosyltransferase [Candidatus Saccharimonadales bacterium]
MAESNLKKATRIYKNQGLRGLGRKSKSAAQLRLSKLSHKLKAEAETYDQKNLREEYGFVSNELFQITSKDIEHSKVATSGSNPKEIKTATWFVPYYDHFGFNGIQTIFRFIEKLSQEGVRNRIVIYDYPPMDTAKLEREMLSYFPKIKNYEIIVFGDDKEKALAALPPSDIAFCTIWVSAYLLLRYNKAKCKYYFIQDYEPLFYVAGSTYALAESTYRFGFTGIVNTPGLLAAVNQRHGLEGVSFIPAVNAALYYEEPGRKPNQKVRIFFYARPYNPRNSFNLGMVTIQHLLDRYSDKIEIITAGAEWNEAEYGLKGRINNMGLIKSLDEVAALYRTCDIGFAYMLNKHTTYQMMEYSASGMATVMNENEDHHWLHKDGINCLLAEPSPSAMAEKIGLLVDDPTLRRKLVKNAQKELGYSWDQQTESIWNYIKNQ